MYQLRDTEYPPDPPPLCISQPNRTAHYLDAAGNMSSIHKELQTLLDRQRKENSGTSWDLWSWFPTGGLQVVLMRLAMMLVLLAVVGIIICCIIPLVRVMVACLFTTTVLNHTLLSTTPIAYNSDQEEGDSLYQDHELYKHPNDK